MKSPANELDYGKFFGVRASKLSMLTLFRVSERWRTISSMSQRKVVNATLLNKQSLVNVLEARLTFLNKAFQNPPIPRLTGGRIQLNMLLVQSLSSFILVYTS